MFTPRFTAYTQSAAGSRQVAQSNSQQAAWSLAMQATQHAAHDNPSLAHAAVLFDQVAGDWLPAIPFKKR